MSRPRCKCGKAIYRDKIDAIVSCKRMKNVAMNIYKCPNGKWHLGKTRDPLRCAWRIDEILERHNRELNCRINRAKEIGMLSNEYINLDTETALLEISASPCKLGASNVFPPADQSPEGGDA